MKCLLDNSKHFIFTSNSQFKYESLFDESLFDESVKKWKLSERYPANIAGSSYYLIRVWEFEDEKEMESYAFLRLLEA